MIKASPYSAFRHRFAAATVSVTLVTLVAGALVTSKNAGMAFRDWPTSDGHFMVTYPWLADFARDWDKFLEHGHRLAGMLIVSADEEEALGLPSDAYDLPIVLQDRLFDADNQLVYPDDMTSQMMGFLGDQTLTNGLPFPPLMETRAYRLRLRLGRAAQSFGACLLRPGR